MMNLNRNTAIILVFILSFIPAIKTAAADMQSVGTVVSGEADFEEITAVTVDPSVQGNEDYIKWVDFTPTYKVLEKALSLDIKAHEEGRELNWIDMLAYLGAKYGGDFSKYKEKDLTNLADKLNNGELIADMTAQMKYYGYYHEAYTAVLGEFVGSYKVTYNENGNVVWKEKYGLKVYSPIARTFPYQHFDDFGAGRSYGYKRKHLGHDLMAQVGTPVISVETGIVEVMGWNKYGGWRIGIRSIDGKRYYYYAHLRKNRPYHCDLKEGDTVKAGDVIGYVGRSGYSTNENTNNIDKSHLHYGMQLIFDPSQKEGAKEIWIDMYAITKLLERHKSETVRNGETKEFYRSGDFDEDLLHEGLVEGEELLPTPAPAGVMFPLHGQAKDRDESQVELPVLMYHTITKGKSVNKKFQINVKDLEKDLKYLKNNGYTTIVMKDVIDFVKEEKPLPEKPIVLTFDDGNYSDYKYLFPLLQEYGAKAVISVVGKLTDQYSEDKRSINFPHLTWQQINEMLSSGNVEIQNHSYNMHSEGGSKKKKNEEVSAYHKRFTNDLLRMQKRTHEMTGYFPSVFTYPFGAISDESTEALKEIGISAGLSCKEGLNYIKMGDTEGLYRLNRYNRSLSRSAEQILMSIQRSGTA